MRSASPAPTFPLRTLLRLTFLLLLGAAFAPAQDVPGASFGSADSRLDLAGAYGYIRPFTSDIHLIVYQPILGGGIFSGAYYFKPRLGLQVEGIYSPAAYNDNNCVYTAQAGPIFRVHRGRFVPYVHALGGAAEIGGPSNQTCSVWGWGLTLGGGVDYVLPLLNNHLALRLVQADFNYSHVTNPEPPNHDVTFGGVGALFDAHLSGGLVLRLNGIHRGANNSDDPSLACSANPGNPFPGDPVTITSTIENLRSDGKSEHDLRYLWEASDGHIAGNGPTAAVDTLGLAPGTHTVAGHLVRGPHNKQVAACTTSFTVRRIEPPTVTCSTDRAAINSGDPVIVTAVGRSPQNLALTYSYTATNGVVTGDGPSATLSTIGSTPGTITVTCSVADTHGQTASATTSTVIAIPTPAAPKPSAQSLCGISFERDRKRPVRVDNEAKACLDDIALTLARTPEARLLILGNHDTAEQNRNAAERALNTAQYLTDEKGIDPGRLDLRLGNTAARSVATMLVPPGATLDAATGTRFDSKTISRTGQPYGRPGTSNATPARPIHRRRGATPTRSTTQPTEP